MRVDTLLHHARVITVDGARPRAAEVAVVGDRIVAVGHDGELRGQVEADHDLDLDGRTVVPGFNDAHNHQLFYGMSLAEVPLSAAVVHTVDDIYAAIGAEAARTPAGAWVVGWGYDQNKLPGGLHPTAEGLDRVAPDHLVWLKHTSGHMSVVNGRVLAEIGDAPVPDGGRVETDDAGRPTGLLQEQAQLLVRGLRFPYPRADLVAALGRASERYVAEGVTSCTEAGVGGNALAWSPLEMRVYLEAHEQGVLRNRMTLMPAVETLHDAGAHPDEADGFGLDLGLRTGFGGDWLRLGPVKLFADGSLIGRTAAMFDDFADAPCNHGFFQTEPELLRDRILRAHAAGWQVATHAIGDRAVATVLDIYEEALARQPRADHRHRIEHCGVIAEDLLDRLAGSGVIPVPQGRFISEIGDGMLDALGPERAAGCYRQRSFVDRGIPLPGSSDRPVVNGSPLLGIHDMVNQRTASGRPFAPAEALTPEQALAAYTLGSAHAVFEEHRKGSLTPGKLADLVVLSDDPTAIDPAGIADLDVLATMIGGHWAHDTVGLSGVA